MKFLLPLLLGILLIPVAEAGPAMPPNPAAIYEQNCASCHARPETKAPPIESLRKLSMQKIHQTLELGIMQPIAAHLSAEDRLVVATWLAATEDAQRNQWLTKQACPRDTPMDLTGDENWGMGAHNHRHAASAITPANVERLALRWSVALPTVGAMRSLPVVAGGTVFLGGADGRLLAFERHSGCIRWSMKVDAAIRDSLTLERTPDGVPTLYFADELGTVYAVNATNGSLRWRRSMKAHPMNFVSGSIAFHADASGARVYVPLSLYEVMVAPNPKYECCHAHGGVMALDAVTGEPVWHFATTPDAKPTALSSAGTQLWGPSGAPVWNRPTVDAKRGLLYFGTGENASSPATDTSDAIIALDLRTGARRWAFQALANDVWNLACKFKGPNCPKENGPDFDFGASTILVEGGGAGGRDLLLAGQKSGEIFALNPDSGAVVWRHHFTPTATHFNPNGGVHHGMATDGKLLIVPIADPELGPPGHMPQPGVHAVRVSDGKVLWSHRFERGCALDPADKPGANAVNSGQRNPWPACSFFYAPSAAPTLSGGIAWVPTLDGKVHAFEASTGKLLRVIETNKAQVAGNGVEGHGGAIDVAGVRVSGDQLLVPSGYALFGEMPGNMLYVYELQR